MKASELVDVLNEVINNYGDLDVISKIDVTVSSAYTGVVEYVQIDDNKIVIGGEEDY